MTDETTTPRLTNVRRVNGIAGQFAMRADVTYPGEETRTATFTGSVYGGPVVGQFGDMPETFISDPGRFGDFAATPAEWVRRFYGVPLDA